MRTSVYLIATSVLVSAGLLASCDRSSETTETTTTPDTKTAVPEPKATATPAPRPDTPASALYRDSGVPTVTERSIDVLYSVAVRYPTNVPDALVIRATGIVTSKGWWNPRLVPIEEETTDVTVKRYRFVATPPTGDVGAGGGELHVQLRVEGVNPETKTIEVVSATNRVSVVIARPQAPQTAQLR